MIDIEICCNSVASAVAAKEGGARRIELCRDLECGGLTPSDGDIEYCARTLGLRTHVLVRPRPGNFYYNTDEVADIMATIERCRRLGAVAVVVGFLDYDGCVDVGFTRRAVLAADGMEVTFHRAFDDAHQAPMDALAAVAEAGCTRLLTSGQHATAIEGADVIRRMAGATPVKILAGSGVTPENASRIVELTGVSELHGSCKQTLPDGTVRTSAEQVRNLISLFN